MIDLTTKTKANKPRQGKATIGAIQYHCREMTWVVLRQELRDALAKRGHGAQSELACLLGTNPSNIHRYLCEKCEHEIEPSFTMGMMLLVWLNNEQQCQPLQFCNSVTHTL